MSEKILIVDDDPAIRLTLSETLKKGGYEVEKVSSAEEALDRVKFFGFDLILLDVRLPGMSGIEAISHIREMDSHAEIIVITAHDHREVALEAIRNGAYDYFSKPFSLEEMRIVVRRALERKKLQAEIKELRETLERGYAPNKIIGQSQAMKGVIDLVEKVAPLETTVLITGESGTGKELIANTVHYQSKRASGPFIKLNCAAIPENLLESELFGYEKGAFTGAYAQKPGKFELAHHGAIFLDEVGDMSLTTQAKLLRVVEEKRVERLGGRKPILVDVRIIAATNQDLFHMISEKRFRGDLYYRLNVASIHLPPLRERKEDIPLLADHFIRDINIRLGSDLSGLSPEAMEFLLVRSFPGNVRELANVLERAAIQSRGNIITLDDLRMTSRRLPASFPSWVSEKTISLHETLESVEKSLITNALQNNDGVQSKAAEILGVSPKNLWKKIRKHGIEVKKTEG